MREVGLELEVVVERGDSLVPSLFKEDTNKTQQVTFDLANTIFARLVVN